MPYRGGKLYPLWQGNPRKQPGHGVTRKGDQRDQPGAIGADFKRSVRIPGPYKKAFEVTKTVGGRRVKNMTN